MEHVLRLTIYERVCYQELERNFKRILPTKWDWEGLSPTVVAARDVVNSPRAVTSHSAQSYFTTFFQEPSHILFRELLTNK